MKIFSVSGKSIKTEKATGAVNLICYFTPGSAKVCPYASAGCRKACLAANGRFRFSNVRQCQNDRTELFFRDPEEFKARAVAEINKARRTGNRVVVRMDGSSDLNLTEKLGFTAEFPDVTFVDYTKNPERAIKSAGKSNVKTVFSRSESNEPDALRVLAAGGSVAVVFRHKLPETWNGYKVIDGDKHDDRSLDPPNCVVGLLAKGRAKTDKTGFVTE